MSGYINDRTACESTNCPDVVKCPRHITNDLPEELFWSKDFYTEKGCTVNGDD